MGVIFCLICVKIVAPLPFLWHLFLRHLFLPLRAWAVTSLLRRGCTPEPRAKLQWWFWCQGMLRRALGSHLPLGSPIRLRKLLVNAAPGEAGHTGQLWGDWHFPGAVELYSSPPGVHTMETLCCCCTCQPHKARWKWPQWRCHGEKKWRVCTSEQAEPHISCTQRNKQLFRNLL